MTVDPGNAPHEVQPPGLVFMHEGCPAEAVTQFFHAHPDLDPHESGMLLFMGIRGLVANIDPEHVDTLVRMPGSLLGARSPSEQSDKPITPDGLSRREIAVMAIECGLCAVRNACEFTPPKKSRLHFSRDPKKFPETVW